MLGAVLAASVRDLLNRKVADSTPAKDKLRVFQIGIGSRSKLKRSSICTIFRRALYTFMGSPQGWQNA